MKNLYLSVVTPTYNEEKRIEKAIEEVYSYLITKKYPFEMIVVDDASEDNTEKVVKNIQNKRKNLRFFKLSQNQKKGGAVKKGMLEAKGKYILFTDCDQSTPIYQADKLLSKIEESYDIAIGSRNIKGAVLKRRQIWYRDFLGKISRMLCQIFLLRGIGDTQCGFKCFKNEVAKNLFKRQTSKSPIFDMEILALAGLLGYKVAEVPVLWIHDPNTRLSYNLKKIITLFLELLRIKIHLKIIWPVKVQK